MVIGIWIVLGLILVPSILCSSIHGGIRHDWLPRTWSQFVVPSCPLCWWGRTAVVGMALTAFVQLN